MIQLSTVLKSDNHSIALITAIASVKNLVKSLEENKIKYVQLMKKEKDDEKLISKCKKIAKEITTIVGFIL